LRILRVDILLFVVGIDILPHALIGACNILAPFVQPVLLVLRSAVEFRPGCIRIAGNGIIDRLVKTSENTLRVEVIDTLDTDLAYGKQT
jgi:hypothetical protein